MFGGVGGKELGFGGFLGASSEVPKYQTVPYISTTLLGCP